MSEQNELLRIVASQLNKTVCETEIADWNKLMRLAKKQGLLPYVAIYARSLTGHQPDKSIRNDLFTVIVQEAAYSANQLDAVAEMQQEMEKNGIYNLAVKGAVTKRRYPDEVMRSMGDIDLLYKPEQHHVFKALMLSLGYGDYQEGRKNDTYSRPPYITVEAHRELVESGSEYAGYYQNIWNMAHPKEGMKYTYEMTLEDEMIFNVVHLAEHFKEGGAGVRFIIDVYVYSLIDMDRAYVERELRKLGLNEFYQNINALAKHWFADGKSSELTEKLADFIMAGGVFGDHENAAALAVEEGRARRFFKVCFPNYESMKSMYPWLKGKRALLPYAWVLRGVGAVRHRKNNIQAQINWMKTGNAVKAKELREFYTECGL
ncbi:nucleotidyltransferase family protein [Ruminococcus sp.]|uniref:nucleotidyltransferase domain-containing protein n=1 Tax=Ruminococcus sp. TaxID=41978 RepID=UPI00388E81E3